MVDKAALGASPSFAERMLAHSQNSKARAADKVVNLATRAAEAGGPSAEAKLNLAKAKDFTSAIDLIHEASEAVRIAEQRADDLELQMRGLLTDAAEELSRLKLEIAEKDATIARCLEQAQAAELRAQDAEAWLARLNEAVMSRLAPLQKRKA